ncbi:hypothetical protein HPP92_023944 [Vanilla planifolia]|uniref:PRONE domain-containing protein n=1 Tax=Vanilla planifolia TaxID=51239 RepID=A0A835PN99_VANPL|nr:hypothetical protein HPP92_023944 [Vanilla planifolia]
MFDASGRNWGGNEETTAFWIQGGRMEQPAVGKQTGWAALDQMDGKAAQSRLSKEGTCPRCGSGQNRQHTDVEQMKEMFAKLLLGEDMSGGGKGVSSSLALSNAITNHAASVFGEQVRLEPMSAERKARWRREIDWLLSVTDYIVELVPSQQVGSDGTKMEIMTTQQRKDLLVNIPALRKLDAMLIGYLDNFKDKNEFWYVNEDAEDTEKGNAERKDDKWWLPTVKVPPNGLSDVSRKWLQFQKESVNQVLKAAMAINAQVLMEMEIPEAYIDSLPKNGRASLGDLLYRNITVEYFDPSQFLASVDLSTEHRVVDLKNRIEASVVIWNRKMHNKDVKAWAPGVSLEKREQFEERAQTILHLLKHRFPGIPQSALDICKIQFNKDVGLSILESYSRILESLAHTVVSKIEDVLHADWLARDPGERLSVEEPGMTRLSDFMGWTLEQESENGKEADGREDMLVLEESQMKKPPGVLTQRVPSYTENLECLGGLRSPTSRH